MIDNETIRNAMISREFLAGIAGALVGGFVTYLGAIEITRRARRDAARDEFRKAIMPTLAKARRQNADNPIFPVLDMDSSQYAAYLHFKRHVRSWKRRSFEKAWHEYYEKATTGETSNDRATRADYFHFIEERLEALLKFT